MKWIELDLNRVSDIEKQADEVIRTYETLHRQQQSGKRSGTGNQQQISKAIQVLRQAILNRILALEHFYRENDLDSRAHRMETCRLKLKRALKDSGTNVAELLATQQPGSSAGTAKTPSGHTKETLVMPLNDVMQSMSNSRPQQSTSSRNLFDRGNEQAQRENEQPGSVTLKIQLTHAEFEELRLRRQALREVLKKGEGKQAWESSGAQNVLRGANPSTQGMYTFHEIPYGQHHKPPQLTSPRETAAGNLKFSAPKMPVSEFINTGTPYLSVHPDVQAKTMRFPTGPDAFRGGERALNQEKPFNSITPRTDSKSQLSRVKPVGSK